MRKTISKRSKVRSKTRSKARPLARAKARQLYSQVGVAKKPSRVGAAKRVRLSKKKVRKTPRGAVIARSRTITATRGATKETPTRELLSDIAKVGRQLRRRVRRAL